MLRALTLASLCAMPLAAQAQDDKFYLGAGYASSDYGLSRPPNLAFDDEDGGWKLFGGWRPLKNFGIEASYADHGDLDIPTGIVCIALFNVPCPATVNVDAQTASLFAVGYLDLPVVELFAKAGITAWDFDGRASPAFPSFRFNESGTGFAWGAGAQVRLGQLGIRGEYERLEVIASEDVGVVSLSLTWNF